MFKKSNNKINIFTAKVSESGKFNDVVEYTILLALTVFAILTVINGINTIIIIRPLLISLSSHSVITHKGLFPYLATFNTLHHGNKDVAIQIIIIKLFAVLISEIGLLSIVAGLFALKKVLGYMPIFSNANLVADNRLFASSDVAEINK